MELETNALGQQHTRLGPSTRALLSELAQTHSTLWQLEDGARSRAATDQVIAAAKRNIDIVNGKRHQIIDAIDGEAAYTPSSHANVFFSETFGEICDRLIIMTLKISNLESQLASGELAADAVARGERKHIGLVHWRRYLQERMAEMLDAQASGTAVMPPRSEFKLYNDRQFNPILRKEDAGE